LSARRLNASPICAGSAVGFAAPPRAAVNSWASCLQSAESTPVPPVVVAAVPATVVAEVPATVVAVVPATVVPEPLGADVTAADCSVVAAAVVSDESSSPPQAASASNPLTAKPTAAARRVKRWVMVCVSPGEVVGGCR
jgi:hypothetical protein